MRLPAALRRPGIWVLALFSAVAVTRHRSIDRDERRLGIGRHRPVTADRGSTG